ncbi:histone-lysine N-methyltransferase NSD2-like [Physella acuta]|uniref:histone-lysine N-methyltransferase NSD2-like n=1 Tax=Physella acuta TaxID=109671 RepID=UPI0027DB0728|nr:histone-lysine N-methyltransferase NSD2-like [Physella acuta]
MKRCAEETPTNPGPSSKKIVPIRRKELPSKEQLKKVLATAGSSSRPSEVRRARWQEGDLLWAKIRGYPFWPSMVSRDPFSNLFTKSLGEYILLISSPNLWRAETDLYLTSKEKTIRKYHVQFFGVRTERSWVTEASVMEFEGREKFLEIVRFGLESPTKNCRKVSDFKVNEMWLHSWTIAVIQAESAAKLEIEERKERYLFQYVMMTGNGQRPVSQLLETIWKRASNNSKGSGSDDEDDIYSELYQERRQTQWYDSDDLISSDDSADEKKPPRRAPVKIKVREGTFDVFLAKHERFIRLKHPDWPREDIIEYLSQQWAIMKPHYRRRYTTRLKKPIYIESRHQKKQVSLLFGSVQRLAMARLPLVRDSL